MSNANKFGIRIASNVTELSTLLRSSDASVFIQRFAGASYLRPLIATDLEQAESVLPALRMCDDAATIIVLSAFKIPYSGLHMVHRKARLEAAIQQTTED